MDLVQASLSSSSSYSADPATEQSTSKRPRFAGSGAVTAKRNVQQKMFELAEKDSDRFAQFMKESREVDKEVVELLRENNRLMEKLIDKI